VDHGHRGNQGNVEEEHEEAVVDHEEDDLIVPISMHIWNIERHNVNIATAPMIYYVVAIMHVVNYWMHLEDWTLYRQSGPILLLCGGNSNLVEAVYMTDTDHSVGAEDEVAVVMDGVFAVDLLVEDDLNRECNDEDENRQMMTMNRKMDRAKRRNKMKHQRIRMPFAVTRYWISC